MEAELDAISRQALAQLREEHGSIVLEFQRDIPAAIQACGSPDLRTRTIALQVVAETATVAPDLPQHLAAILRSDDPVGLRQLASSMLGSCAVHKVPFPYLAVLLPIVEDGQTEAELRVFAYTTARLAHHVANWKPGDRIGLPPVAEVLSDIDWSWVNAIRGEDTATSHPA